ncbi:helix-turn-helix domain-containing protein [Paenibacillus alkaliterrae]|uniref:helix-turn-helix domain-containing protein n=1 Tax=Paenibacillus alkaliterrae TaxID=320909 RepID=UPI001F20BCB3|nr:helix-turn-helix domain-containing protein [Paenibacillus alkaliterrae]MCF2941079.1 helix-turn-helix domain-containing protein [Paenibacillus alkaliterrae]
MPLFYKYLISYLALLIIPLLLIGLLVYQHYVAILKDEITSNHQRMLEQIQDSFDSKIKEMNKISAEIASKPELTPYQLKQNMYNAVKAKNLFLTYTSANIFIKEVFLYIKDQPYVYSGSSTYPTALFIDTFYRYENWSFEQFTKDMSELDRPVLRHSEPIASARLTDDRVLTYLVPLPLNAASPYGSVMFVIEEKTVRKMLQGLLDNSDGNTVILDEKGNRVVSLRDEAYLEQSGFHRQAERLPIGTSTGMLDGKEYAFSKVRSDDFNWTYITMLPIEQFMQRVGEVKSRALLSLGMVLVIGCALIYAMLHFNYHPLRRFLLFTGKQWGESYRNLNEVLHAVHKITEEKQMLGRALNDSRIAVHEHMLLALMTGRVTDPEPFLEKAGEAGIRFTKSGLFVVRLAVRYMENLPRQQQIGILDGMEAMMRDRFECYRVEGLEGPIVNFICAVGPEDGEWPREMKELHGAIRERYGIDVTVGAGNRRQDIRQLGKSFIEASTALDFRLLKGYNEVILYADIADQTNLGCNYPRQDIETMEVLIRQGDTESLTKVVRGILSFIESSAMPLHMVRCICYDMINCIVKETYRLKGTLETADESYPDVFSLTKFDTIQELADVIEVMCGQLCADIVRSQSESKSGGQKQEMLDYIQANYDDQQFSVQNMADHFAISASYLKRQFKEQTGKTITDFLNHYRMEQAKHLLRTTDMKLKDIVPRIGYFDVPSFIRKFKQAFKVTPGDYRKLYETKEHRSE